MAIPFNKMNKKEKKEKAKDIIKVTKKDFKYIKDMRALGASDREIAIALEIPEKSLLLL